MKARKEIDDTAVELRNYHHTAVAKNQTSQGTSNSPTRS